MIRRIVIIVLAGALLAAGVLAWRYFFPDDETRIKRVLDSAADAVGIASGESAPTAIGKLRRLESLLEEQVEVDIRANRETYGRIFARGEIVNILMAERRTGTQLKVELADFTVTITDDTARVEAAATVRYKNGAREFSPEEEIRFELVRREGKWRIARVYIRNFMEK